MTKDDRTSLGKVFGLLAVICFGVLPLLKADVVVLQNGAVITGNVLQQDGNGVLLQMESGTYRYPLAWIKDVKKEAVAAPHVSNNGQVIPNWAQIVTLLANNGWAPEIKQVPATVINYGNFKYVPYVSFRCAYGGYEINIFGDLNHPAAVQIGAMNYLKQSDEARSNCVNFVCSVLASAADRKIIRALNWNQKDVEQNGGMTFETLLPGEMGSYGGWWVSVYNTNELAGAQASEAELLAITQPRVEAAQPVAAIAQPGTTNVVAQSGVTTPQPAATITDPGMITSDGTYSTASGWTAEELANARSGTPAASPSITGDNSSSAGDMVYPRAYTRTGGTYGHAGTRR
jgi:hypothetical protein